MEWGKGHMRVRGHRQPRPRWCLRAAGGQLVQAGPDVLAVVVALLLVEGGLGVQALECDLQLPQLCLPPLPVPALVADVLGLGDRRAQALREPRALPGSVFRRSRERPILQLLLPGGRPAQGLQPKPSRDARGGVTVQGSKQSCRNGPLPETFPSERALQGVSASPGW